LHLAYPPHCTLPHTILLGILYVANLSARRRAVPWSGLYPSPSPRCLGRHPTESSRCRPRRAKDGY
jgi:hypothetical protein